ncbi:MAG: leucine-rich repeat domain-containing protein [Ruminococcus albus]|nr:leucine-rich repeat domain-containing protein [Ruminococcus albus]
MVNTNKKIAAGLLALTFVFGGAVLPSGVVGNSVVASASAEKLTYGNFTYTMLEDGTIEISKYTGSETAVEIPDEINGVAVTSIGVNAFGSFKNLENVIFPKKLRSIGFAAFCGCDSLKEISFPKGLKTIGYASFAQCSSLKKVDLPDSLETIEGNAFSLCRNLESISFPDNLKYIGETAFASCEKFNVIMVPDSVETIEDTAFAGCNNLEYITLPKNLMTISSSLFGGCTKLKTVVIPDGVTNICEYAFAGCNSLENISIPESVISIGKEAFRDCNTLGSVFIPASVTDIGEDAFSYSVPETKTLKSLSNITLYIHKDSVAKQYALENSINFRVVDIEGKTRYPEISSVMHSADYHQFLVSWSSVSGAEKYGIAVQLAGKWRVQLYSNTPVITSPRLNPGDTYKLLIAAKVNGEWDLSNINSRAFTVTVK